ncbi:MAG: FtsH protease activity modulator HflK [Thermodesulfobacteriota bacterium]
MSWDWDKLQQRRQRPFGGGGGGGRDSGGGGGGGPSFPDFSADLKRIKNFRFPVWWFAILLGVLWLASGLYIVEPAEIGVVQRFGAYDRQTEPGLHYHLPFPIEYVQTPKVTQVRRAEVGFRTLGRAGSQQFRLVPEESLMLTGDENIVDVQFIVQYMIKDAVQYLFNVNEPDQTVKNAAEAAMREVVGYNQIDAVLTTNKLDIQNHARDLMQTILDIYKTGIHVQAVQLQDVHPPKEVIDAFKDVASAREDKSRFINEADAYKNDILPKARGQAAVLVNQATAYKEQAVLRARGEADRFASVLKEYNKAKEVTRSRLYLETMERVLQNPEMDKVIISDEALTKAVPYLPLSPRGGAGRKGGE